MRVEIAAQEARFHFEAMIRIVIHMGDQHFVLLEYSDGVTRVHESDAIGEIRGDWLGLVVADSFGAAIEELGSWCCAVSSDALLSVVEPIRAERLQQRSSDLSSSQPPAIRQIQMGGARFASSP